MSGDMAVWDMMRDAEVRQNGAIKKMFDRQMGDEVSVCGTCKTYSNPPGETDRGTVIVQANGIGIPV